MEQSKISTMRTPLYETHQKLGAKFVNFSGWDMPIQYSSILNEHLAVRTNIGLFDISHMGRLVIQGTQAGAFLDFLSTNHIQGKDNQTATYTVWTSETGGSVDDVLVYQENPTHFFAIANAANRQKNLAHLFNHAKDFDVTVSHHYDDEGILAVQGPHSFTLIYDLFPETVALKPFHWTTIPFQESSLIISCTGYTGEKGFEFYVPQQLLKPLWELLMTQGKQYDIQPIGLGARDTLRLEMGYALYGHELTESISPLESVSGWTIKWDKSDFLGKQVLDHMHHTKQHRHAYGVVLKEKAVPREGFAVYREECPIGTVTSGGYSPSLNQSIALILVDRELHIDDTVCIEIRNKKHLGSIIKLPFYHRQEHI